MLAPQKGQDVSTGAHLLKLLAQVCRFQLQEHIHDAATLPVGKEPFQAAFEWPYPIAEFVNATSTVKCPVAAKNIYRAPCDEWWPAC